MKTVKRIAEGEKISGKDTKSKKERFLDWFKELGPLLSLLSLVISVIIAYSLYWNTGAITIDMPDEVALKSYNFPSLQVYATFSNNGSPNTWMTIRDVSATAWIHRENKSDEELQFKWIYTNRFISKLEYERLYPNQTQINAEDYLIYESRKAPFTVQGKATVSKLLQFISPDKLSSLSGPFTLEIKIEATTMDNKTYSSPKILYHGDESDAKAITQSGLNWFISRN